MKNIEEAKKAALDWVTNSKVFTWEDSYYFDANLEAIETILNSNGYEIREV